MKQITNRISILAIASLFSIGAMSACGNATETAANNKSSVGTAQSGSAANDKTTVENKLAENKQTNERSMQNESDIGKDISAIKVLKGNDEKLRQQTLDEVLRHPNDYNPVVLCVLSQVSFEQGKQDVAAFWFYTCQLRARIDSNLSTDNSTGNAVTVLTQTFGPKINMLLKILIIWKKLSIK